MAENESLREKIERNQRYLVHAKAAVLEVQTIIAGCDLDNTHASELVRQGKININSSIKKVNMGRYKSMVNGKGWRKLSI